MTDFKYIKYNTLEDVAIITFNRPKHNVMNIEMIEEINYQLRIISKNNSLKALLLNAEGSSWCAGVEVSDHKPSMADNMIKIFTDMFFILHSIEIPIISSIYGACLGGGMEVAIACDIILASKNAFFGQPEIKLGFLPPYAAIRLPKLIGPSKTVDILTTGRRFKTQECFDMGIISKVSGPDKKDLINCTEEILKEIRESSPLIIRLNKRAVIENLNIDLNRDFKKVNTLFLKDLMNTEDVREGIKSFEEKRKPLWLNK